MALPLSDKEIDRLQVGTTERLVGKHLPASAGLRVNLSVDSQVKSGWRLQRMGWELQWEGSGQGGDGPLSSHFLAVVIW